MMNFRRIQSLIVAIGIAGLTTPQPGIADDCTCQWNVTVDASGNVTYQLLKACETANCVCPMPTKGDAVEKAQNRRPATNARSTTASGVQSPAGCSAYVPPINEERETEIQSDDVDDSSFVMFLPTQSYLVGTDVKRNTAVKLPLPSSGSSRTTIGTIRPGVRITVNVEKLTAAVTPSAPPLDGKKVYWLSTPFRKVSDHDKLYWRHLPILTKDAGDRDIEFFRLVEGGSMGTDRWFKFTIKCVADTF